ncbi:MAG: general secretion pathway protein GspG [Crocinitomicaceae bacterium]|nr:general secretion pathway protein GspG [Crocinitomicaceae bacterium]|tara:strand:- start:3486 stop:3899 length:414 start_codon:yes stop_codon:yes gene_type:complete
MKSRINSRRIHAFSLTELLIVLAIIGILILVALPNLMPKIAEAKAQEAKLQLKHIHTLEKTYFYVHSKYSNDFNDLGFEHSNLVTNGGQANYQIEVVEHSNTGYLARATAVVDFDGDGQYNVWEVDQDLQLKEVIKD